MIQGQKDANISMGPNQDLLPPCKRSEKDNNVPLLISQFSVWHLVPPWRYLGWGVGSSPSWFTWLIWKIISRRAGESAPWEPGRRRWGVCGGVGGPPLPRTRSQLPVQLPRSVGGHIILCISLLEQNWKVGPPAGRGRLVTSTGCLPAH